jgi:hypothetical protein
VTPNPFTSTPHLVKWMKLVFGCWLFLLVKRLFELAVALPCRVHE